MRVCVSARVDTDLMDAAIAATADLLDELEEGIWVP